MQRQQAEEPRLNRGDGTFALVVAPTRELSIQINDVLATLLRRYHWLVSTDTLLFSPPVPCKFSESASVLTSVRRIVSPVL